MFASILIWILDYVYGMGNKKKFADTHTEIRTRPTTNVSYLMVCGVCVSASHTWFGCFWARNQVST